MKTLIVGGNSSLSVELLPVLSDFSDTITAGRRNCDINLDLGRPAEDIIFPAGINVIVHMAAHFGGTGDADLLDAEHINALGTLKLCQAAVKYGVQHFIYISSIFAQHPEFENNIYSLSKKHGEDLAMLYCRSHSLALTIIRPSQLYGSSDSFRKHQPFFYHMIDKAEKGDDIALYGSHDPIRNYIHVQDVAIAIAETIKRKLAGTYSCTSTTNTTYSTIAKAAYAAFGTTGKVYFLPDKPGIPDRTVRPDDTLYKAIEYYPRISIEEGIKRVADFRRSIK